MRALSSEYLLTVSFISEGEIAINKTDMTEAKEDTEWISSLYRPEKIVIEARPERGHISVERGMGDYRIPKNIVNYEVYCGSFVDLLLAAGHLMEW